MCEKHMAFFIYYFKMAGAEGFEPPITGPKPVALPLGHAPTRKSQFFLSTTLHPLKCDELRQDP